MSWQTAIYLGALGGAIVEIINVYTLMTSWQAARHHSRSQNKALPAFKKYIDPPADTLVALTRLVLGALAGWAFHPQIVGASAAIAVGASAPALLKQFGTMRSVREAVQGGSVSLAGESQKSETSPPSLNAIPSISVTSGEMGLGNQGQEMVD